ncbi:MAG: hypothetical protein H5U38_03100 [Calditrichaeota bacterium]|nr:hypothetical protein [Calditrichota bacterium]
MAYFCNILPARRSNEVNIELTQKDKEEQEMEFVAPVVVPVAFFATVVWIVKLVAENKTRRRAIDRGLTGQDLAQLFRGDVAVASALKWAFVLIAIGLGLIIGLFLVPEDVQPEATLTSCVVLAGVALVVYYLLTKKGRV